MGNPLAGKQRDPHTEELAQNLRSEQLFPQQRPGNCLRESPWPRFSLAPPWRHGARAKDGASFGARAPGAKDYLAKSDHCNRQLRCQSKPSTKQMIQRMYTDWNPQRSGRTRTMLLTCDLA